MSSNCSLKDQLFDKLTKLKLQNLISPLSLLDFDDICDITEVQWCRDTSHVGHILGSVVFNFVQKLKHGMTVPHAIALQVAQVVRYWQGASANLATSAQ